MTNDRRHQLDLQLRRLRNHPNLFCGDELLENRISKIITTTKLRLSPIWEEEHRIRKDNDFKRRYENGVI